MDPLFSIITVTYNAANTLSATLKSIEEQTCKLYEYILIDGASTDETVAIAEKSGINNKSILSEKDKGIYDAMNKGLDMAKGDYVIFLNAGDAFHSQDTLQIIADAVFDNDYPGIVYGQTQIVDSQGRRISDRHLRAPETLNLESFKAGMTVCHQAFIVLRKLTESYDLRYKFSADFDWCIRCLQRSQRNLYIDDILIDYLAEGVTTANHKASLMERFKIMSYYYGFFPTLLRHIGFIFRALGRKLRK